MTDRSTSDKTTTQPLTAPRLPATIAGDGRYVMSLLNDFCQNVTDTLTQVEEQIATPAPATIDNFFVTFDRQGILWQWDSVPNAKYYELYWQNTLLERTDKTTGRTAPATYTGTVTLTAVLTDRTISETLSYAKPRPSAPQYLNTTRTDTTIDIDYPAIPTDCIGIELTIDGQTYRTTQDRLSLPLSQSATHLSAAYYDNFGTGDAVTTDNTTANVTRFFAEQNGDWVDFSWDSIPCSNATYIIKTAFTAPDWNSATALLSTTQNHARIRFPQQGKVYFLIKAVNNAGCYSPQATCATLDRAADQARNIILTVDPAECCYSHSKTNLYYDAVANGLRLTDSTRRGEYLLPVHLPTTYRARNWLEYKLIGVTDETLIWDDGNFNWTSDDASSTIWNGASGDISEAVLTKEIAESITPPAGQTTWSMANTLIGSDNTAPTQAQHTDTFDLARWDYGLCLTPLTQLTYPINNLTCFTLIFHLTAEPNLPHSEIVTLYGTDGALTLRYRNGALTLTATDGITLTLDYLPTTYDQLTLGISQTATTRTLRLNSLAQNTDRNATATTPPCTTITAISYHPTAHT